MCVDGASHASWITITSGGTGTGNGSVGFLVLPNVGGSRNGTLTIASRTFTVTQAAVAPCNYSISPNNQRVGSRADSRSVSVDTASHCAWTASSNDSWITDIRRERHRGRHGKVQLHHVQRRTGPQRISTVPEGLHDSTGKGRRLREGGRPAGQQEAPVQKNRPYVSISAFRVSAVDDRKAQRLLFGEPEPVHLSTATCPPEFTGSK